MGPGRYPGGPVVPLEPVERARTKWTLLMEHFSSLLDLYSGQAQSASEKS